MAGSLDGSWTRGPRPRCCATPIDLDDQLHLRIVIEPVRPRPQVPDLWTIAMRRCWSQLLVGGFVSLSSTGSVPIRPHLLVEWDRNGKTGTPQSLWKTPVPLGSQRARSHGGTKRGGGSTDPPTWVTTSGRILKAPRWSVMARSPSRRHQSCGGEIQEGTVLHGTFVNAQFSVPVQVPLTIRLFAAKADAVALTATNPACLLVPRPGLHTGKPWAHTSEQAIRRVQVGGTNSRTLSWTGM
jgi:hypothetical protein